MISKRIVLLLFAVLSVPLMISLASADHEWDHRLAISGVVVDDSGDPVRRRTISVDCSEGATDPSLCGHNRGRNDKTSLFSGEFTLNLHIHPTDSDKVLVLLIEGEQFEMTTDLEGGDGVATENDRQVTMDIQLVTTVDYTSDLITLLIAVIVFAIPLAFIIKKTGFNPFTGLKSSNKAAARKVTEELELSPCPRCKAEVKAENLLRHLTQKHNMSKSNASDLIADSASSLDEDE